MRTMRTSLIALAAFLVAQNGVVASPNESQVELEQHNQQQWQHQQQQIAPIHQQQQLAPGHHQQQQLAPHQQQQLAPHQQQQLAPHQQQQQRQQHQQQQQHINEKPSIIFSPNPLSLADITQQGTQFGVRLNKPPSSHQNAIVFLEANGLRFSKCALQFNQWNYDKTQTVVVEPIPFFDKRVDGKLDVQIKAKIYTEDGQGDFNGFETQVPVSRDVKSGASCLSWGDPHIVSWDGSKYDVQRPGAFWLVKSPELLVQVLHYPCNNKVTCNAAVAVQYRQDVVVLSSSYNPTNGQTTKLFRGTAKLNSLTPCSSKSGDKKIQRHELILSDGTKVSLSVNYWDGPKTWQGDVQVWSPSKYFNAVTGMCGTYNANPADDLTTASGEVVKDATVFGDSWRVADSDNLFNRCASNPGACQLDHLIQPINSNRRVANHICQIPKAFKPGTKGYIPFTASDGFQVVSEEEIPIVVAEAVTAPQTTFTTISRRDAITLEATPEFRQRAKDLCSNVMKSENCHKFVDPQPYIDSCEKDAVMMVSLDGVEDAKETYLNTCREVTNSHLHNAGLVGHNRALRKELVKRRLQTLHKRDDLNEMLLEAITAQEEVGLASNACPNNCSGRGQCIALSCQCDKPFTGLSCEIDTSEIEAETGIASARAAMELAMVGGSA
ncbi:hypothetical protein HK102_002243 [Quaeritorhiza haematococci]|nr:hypothetical protein HK102_002243 [Quaeritorhiza haematococci]